MQKYEKELIWQEKTFYVGSILLFLTPGCIVFSVVLGSEGRANLQRRQTGGRGHPFTMSSKICSILKTTVQPLMLAFQRYSATVQNLSTHIRKRHILITTVAL